MFLVVALPPSHRQSVFIRWLFLFQVSFVFRVHLVAFLPPYPLLFPWFISVTGACFPLHLHGSSYLGFQDLLALGSVSVYEVTANNYYCGSSRCFFDTQPNHCGSGVKLYINAQALSKNLMLLAKWKTKSSSWKCCFYNNQFELKYRNWDENLLVIIIIIINYYK